MTENTDIHRNPDGSFDFDFYRRRAARERRLAQRLWLKRNLAALRQMVSGAIGKLERPAFRPAPPSTPCCLAAARRECCA